MALTRTLNTSSVKFEAGGVASANANTLDAYVEGTWTPGITLGGAAVGVTYTSQTAAYTRVGNRIFFNVYIVLSSKGSSTGALLVTGLPVASGWGAYQPCSLRITSVTAGVGNEMLMAAVVNSATTIALFDISGGTIATITDVDLTNTSTIEISGQYLV